MKAYDEKLKHEYETHDWDNDQTWQMLCAQVHAQEGKEKDKLKALEDIKPKYWEEHVAPSFPPPYYQDEEDPATMEERMMKDKDAMKMMDQGLKLMWKIGVMEAEEIVREVVREIGDPKSKLNKEGKTKKDVIKRRVMGIHHIGEKFKVVAAKMKKEEKKGFTVEEMMGAEKKDQPNGPESSPR